MNYDIKEFIESAEEVGYIDIYRGDDDFEAIIKILKESLK